MRRFGLAVSGVLALLLAGAVVAEEAPEPPKPGPEHQKMAYWVGKWSGKGEAKPGPFGPAGPMTWTETCEWFPGGFSVVCHSDGKGPMGETKGLSILGWNPREKAYTFHGIDSSGWAGGATGTVQGDVWTYTNEEKMGDKTYKARFVLTRLSPSSQKLKWEVSEDGSSWSTMMDGESTKVK